MTAGRIIAGATPRSIVGTVAVLCMSGFSAAAAPPNSVGSHPAPKVQESSAQHPAETDLSSRNVVARARMLECGHQWNSLKKSGTASGTWKDFSRSCLAQR